jgi:hypothetical protein
VIWASVLLRLKRPDNFAVDRGSNSRNPAIPFPPNVNTLRFSQVCVRISAELIVLENEQYLARLADPEYRAFLAGLFRMALSAEDDDPTASGVAALFPQS